MTTQPLDCTLTPGANWARTCRRGSQLTLTDVNGGANAAHRDGDLLRTACPENERGYTATAEVLA